MYLGVLSIKININDLKQRLNSITDSSTDEFYQLGFGKSTIRVRKFPQNQLKLNYDDETITFTFAFGNKILSSITISSLGVTVVPDTTNSIFYFYAIFDGWLYINSNFADILRNIKPQQLPTINTSKHFNEILDDLIYNCTTPVLGVNLISENIETHFSPAETFEQNIIKNKKLNLDDYSILTNTQDVAVLLEKKFNEYMAENYNSISCETPLGFTLSGGDDSSLIAYFARKLYPTNHFYGIAISTTDQQLERINAMAKLLNFKDVLIFKDKITLEPLDALDIYQGIYSSIFSHLAQSLAKKNINLLFTGDGGDALLRMPKNNQQTRNWDKALNVSNLPLIPFDARLGAVSFHNSFFSQNVWPISPFLSSELSVLLALVDPALKNKKDLYKEIERYFGFPINMLYYNKKDSLTPLLEEQKQLFVDFSNKECDSVFDAYSKYKIDQFLTNYEQLKTNKTVKS